MRPVFPDFEYTSRNTGIKNTQFAQQIAPLAPLDRAFAMSLVQHLVRKGHLSDKQTHWANVLAHRAVGAEDPPSPDSTVDLTKVDLRTLLDEVQRRAGRPG